MVRCVGLCCLVLLVLSSLPLGAADSEDQVSKVHQQYVSEPVSIRFVSEVRSIEPGKTFSVGLFLQHGPGFHTYWRCPGVVGLPTSVVEWRMPEGFVAGPIQWPQPELTKMAVYTVWGYEADTLLMMNITPGDSVKPGETVSIEARVQWMSCAQTCHPNAQTFGMQIPVSSESKLDPTWSDKFRETRKRVPVSMPQWHVAARRVNEEYTMWITPRGPVNKNVQHAYFFSGDRQISSDDPQIVDRQGNTLIIHMKREENTPVERPTRIEGVLYSHDGWLVGGNRHSMRVNVPLRN